MSRVFFFLQTSELPIESSIFVSSVTVTNTNVKLTGNVSGFSIYVNTVQFDKSRFTSQLCKPSKEDDRW